MYGKMQQSGLIEIIPWICIFTFQGPGSCFFPSWILLRAHRLLMAAGAEGLIAGSVHCLLKWQATFFVWSITVLRRYNTTYKGDVYVESALGGRSEEEGQEQLDNEVCLTGPYWAGRSEPRRSHLCISDVSSCPRYITVIWLLSESWVPWQGPLRIKIKHEKREKMFIYPLSNSKLHPWASRGNQWFCPVSQNVTVCNYLLLILTNMWKGWYDFCTNAMVWCKNLEFPLSVFEIKFISPYFCWWQKD